MCCFHALGRAPRLIRRNGAGTNEVSQRASRIPGGPPGRLPGRLRAALHGCGGTDRRAARRAGAGSAVAAGADGRAWGPGRPLHRRGGALVAAQGRLGRRLRRDVGADQRSAQRLLPARRRSVTKAIGASSMDVRSAKVRALYSKCSHPIYGDDFRWPRRITHHALDDLNETQRRVYRILAAARTRSRPMRCWTGCGPRARSPRRPSTAPSTS